MRDVVDGGRDRFAEAFDVCAFGRGHVVMQVAVSEVAEGGRDDARDFLFHIGGRGRKEFRQLGNRHGNIVLHGAGPAACLRASGMLSRNCQRRAA